MSFEVSGQPHARAALTPKKPRFLLHKCDADPAVNAGELKRTPAFPGNGTQTHLPSSPEPSYCSD